MPFKTGDIVQLKSGGPLMTVDSSDPTSPRGEIVDCLWFTTANECSGGSFHESCLRPDPSAPALKPEPETAADPSFEPTKRCACRPSIRVPQCENIVPPGNVSFCNTCRSSNCYPTHGENG